MQNPNVRFLKAPEVMNLIGVKKTKLYDMVSKGEFPKPTKIGRSSVWSDVAVAEWQREKTEAS